MTEPVRLARRVAERFACSRADAERYIRNGWVTVDGVVVEVPQQRVTDECVELAAEAAQDAVEPATLLLHKPAGVDAFDGAKPPANHWAEDPSGVRLLQRHFHRLTVLVPLDTDASGLLVFSQDGRICRRLTEDADQIEHEYVVEVRGEMAADGLALLNHGLRYRGRALPPCKVSWQNETRLRFAIKALRPGQLQDMCAQVGLAVQAVRRLRIGKVALGKGPNGAMPPGQWRYLPVGERF
jgi:23S rRNA pseudouridine2604 synthase